jgi:UDP-N-acetylmuramyl tripeptide synthase
MAGAILAARAVGWLSRFSGRGASSLPGLVARRIDPLILTRLGQDLVWGTVFMTGTNGKTTTASMVRHMLELRGDVTLSNAAGANLIMGLTAAFVLGHRGRHQSRPALALLETDEATMPKASRELKPRVITVTNFFRDQLDRYGELSTTVRMVSEGIGFLRSGGTLVLNADDPQVASLGRADCTVLYYGLQAEGAVSLEGYDAVDARTCPQCKAALVYDVRYYAHLGHYHCPRCNWSRPIPDIAVQRWDRLQQKAWIRVRGEVRVFAWRAPGLYNLYNEAAAIATAVALDMPLDIVQASLEQFRAAFGRMEMVMAGQTRLWLALVKNPVGFNQVLAALADEERESYSIMVIINDRYADGRDVSWLWDVDFEHWLSRLSPRRWYITGIRARDMAVRLKYAGVVPASAHVEDAVATCLDTALREVGEGTLYILPTYTAMLEVRELLSQRGLVRHFREG